MNLKLLRNQTNLTGLANENNNQISALVLLVEPNTAKYTDINFAKHQFIRILIVKAQRLNEQNSKEQSMVS